MSKKFYQLDGSSDFEAFALDTFMFQAKENPVYSEYIGLLGIDPEKVDTVSKIPFLPIEFFKSHRVISGKGEEEIRFFSSGTTGMQPSIHYLLSKKYYENSFLEGFRLFYGRPEEYCFLALLPSYLERQNSSLVFMMDKLIRLSSYPESGFYLDDLDGLSARLANLENRGIKTILLGVSYALLDLAAKHPMKLASTSVVETGGMKGRREELHREELHKILCRAFGVKEIHSEYGMTELLSQSWSKGKGLFKSPPWMKILIRDPYDPFSYLEEGRSGGINIIDLANRYSCSFIETQDLGRLSSDGFEVIGRFDNSDIRGCNLLVQ